LKSLLISGNDLEKIKEIIEPELSSSGESNTEHSTNKSSKFMAVSQYAAIQNQTGSEDKSNSQTHGSIKKLPSSAVSQKKQHHKTAH
jgi:hypothetical protein